MMQPTPGVIAAGHPKTAEAGIEMFRLGGNAFDAAVAAILASFVAETGLTSAAGGGFLLAHTKDNQNILFDFFTQTPRYKKPEAELNFYPVYVDFGGAVQDFHIGLGSMAVPGNVAGIFHVHQKLGRLPLKVVADPAIHYAKNGLEINDFQAYLFTVLKPILLASERGRQIYAPTGELMGFGGLLTMPDLAETLTYLVEKGAREFYEGEIAQQLVKNCREFGGYLTLEDLKNYRVIERKPFAVNYRDNTLMTNPPPSSGGTLIAFALKLLSKFDLDSLKFGTSEHLKILAEVMRLTNEARKDRLDGYLYQESIAEKFLESVPAIAEVVNKWGSTTHISVVDSEGNAASVTTSNGEGSGYVIPGTGIMVNNMLGEADLNPQGFHQWPENVRISSMMAPTIVLKDNQPEIILGSGGSNRIRTAILQVISNIIDFKMSVTEAVDSPRVHWENNLFSVEPGFDEEEIQKLALPDNQLALWKAKNMFFGGVHAVMETGEEAIAIPSRRSAYAGAGDRRRSGVTRSV